jgi:hypothetical protein
LPANQVKEQLRLAMFGAGKIGGASMEQAVDEIKISFPDSPNPNLKIRVGACRLRIVPGSGAWAAGSFVDPSGRLHAKVEQEGGTARITQDYVGTAWGALFGGGIPKFDLTLGRDKPYSLALETGASEASVDLGGLPITRLTVKQGAGRATIDFSSPNPEAMTLLDTHAGAVMLEMKNLANANFGEMRVEGGAASYKFDFGGSLQRDGQVQIETGMSTVEVRVPKSTAARIAAECALGHLEIGDGLTKRDGSLWTEAAIAGKSPVLTIHVTVTMGALQVRVA